MTQRASQCPMCAGIFDELTAACPHCTQPCEPVVDVPEFMIRAVLSNAGTVEPVRGPASEQLWEMGGGMGALLRF